MKKSITLLLCLFLISTLVLSVSAAGSAHMSISRSTGTVHRGDTFTLTVSLSNDQAIASAGLVLDYDSSVFEILPPPESTCNVANTTFEDVGYDKSSTFAVQPDAIINGTIFTLAIKVKDNAPFGTYSFGGVARLECAGSAVNCTVSGTTVTVACRHSFGAASKADGTTHKMTCSVCGESKQDPHTWNQGTVTKNPTCKNTGTKLVKCTACSAEKTESIPVTSDHKFGDWTSQGGNGHSTKCSVCGREETVDHSWYVYEILQDSTCQTEGSQIIVCEYCGDSAETEIPLADHTYGAPTNVTDDQHTHKCSVCGSEATDDHVFGEELEHDKQMHYYSCQVCGYKKDQAEHNPGPKATEETDQICLVCGRVLKPSGAHVHDFAEAWSSDETNHWHDCADCPARHTEMPHVFDSICDATCDICGRTRQVTHLPLPTLECDETGHWNACYTCGEKQNFSAHVPGPAATVTAPQLCTECHYEIAPILAHDHVYDTEVGLHIHKCACGYEYGADAETCPICKEANPQFPWWIVCILEALVFGGVIAYLILQKKKSAPKAGEND